MSVKQMEKLTVLAKRTDADALLRRLMRLRAVSIDEKAGEALLPLGLSRPESEVLPEVRARLADIEALLPVLTKYSTRKKKLFADAAEVDLDEFRRSGKEEQTRRVVAEASKLLARREELKGRRAELEAQSRALVPYLDLEYDLDFTGTATTVHLVGAFPPGAKIDTVRGVIQDLGVELNFLGEDTAGLYISALCHKRDLDAAEAAFAGIGFLPVRLPEAPMTVKALFDRAELRRQALAEEAESCELRLRSLAANLADVETLADIDRTTLLAEENRLRLVNTGECTVFSMWCPVTAKQKVTAVLEKCAAAYEFEEPAPGDDVPVLLQNNGWARNFEWVLGMYAYPKYGSFDPTFIMSIFYFLLFGLMFADAGYGLVLSLAAFGIVRWCRPRESMKRFLLMFGYCGISCMIFGVLFGAYFGNFPQAFMENILHIPVKELPNLAILPTEVANVALLFDPLVEPMAFLIVALGAGAVHLIVGMAVKAVLLCKEGKPLSALFDIVFYWVLFAGLGLLVYDTKTGLIVTVASAAAIVATHGRHKKGIMKLFGGLLGLYDLISYASDLLSYSRILALGLASAVIGQVVNILATLVGPTPVGLLVMILVFCVGHLLNLVINVLGTYVHTSRLQYIEFFGRFYEEGGTPFKPIAPSDKYVRHAAKGSDGTSAEKTE